MKMEDRKLGGSGARRDHWGTVDGCCIPKVRIHPHTVPQCMMDAMPVPPGESRKGEPSIHQSQGGEP